MTTPTEPAAAPPTPPAARRSGRRRVRVGGIALLCACLSIALLDVSAWLSLRSGGQAAASVLPAPSRTASAPGGRVVPDRLAVPAIGLDARVEGVGATPDLDVEDPHDAADVSWFAAGVVPGRPGDAVMAGKLDAIGEPAAFAELGSLQVGDAITVHLTDGRAVAFRVATIATYAADAQPPGLFAAAGPPTLTLLTSTTGLDGASYPRRLAVEAEPAS